MILKIKTGEDDFTYFEQEYFEISKIDEEDEILDTQKFHLLQRDFRLDAKHYGKDAFLVEVTPEKDGLSLVAFSFAYILNDQGKTIDTIC